MPTDINRFRMKASYQRNMLLANAVVWLLVIVGVVGYYLSDRPPDDVRSVAEPRMLDSRIVIQDSSQVSHDTTHAAVRSLPSLNPYATRHEGFMGFIRLEPKRKVAEQVVKIPEPIYAMEPDLDAIPDLDLTSYALSEGTDTGVFLPEVIDVPAFTPSVSPPPLSRLVMVIDCLPAEVPPIAEMNGKAGYVEILLLIGKDGKPESFSCRTPDGTSTDGPVFELDVVLKNNQQATLQFYISGHNTLQYVTVQETPKDYYFARNLLKVLPQWQFAPAIRDGQPIESFVLVQYHFCRSGDQDCQELSVRSYPS